MILVRGMFFPSEITDSLAQEYGFRFMSDGCVPTGGNSFYNDEVKKYLSKRNGEGWWKRFKEEEAQLKEKAKLKE